MFVDSVVHGPIAHWAFDCPPIHLDHFHLPLQKGFEIRIELILVFDFEIRYVERFPLELFVKLVVLVDVLKFKFRGYLALSFRK